MESLVKQLNLGGPGWIADICDVRLFLGEPGGTQRLAELAPTEIEVEDEPDAPAIFVPLLSNGEAPAGTVVVTPPPGRHVSHHGVTVTLEATLIHFIDGYEPSTTSMIAHTLAIAEPGVIRKRISLPFDFGETYSVGRSLYEAFEGSRVALRYGLVVKVLRPWYTFDVMKYHLFTTTQVQSMQDPAEFSSAHFIRDYVAKWVGDQGNDAVAKVLEDCQAEGEPSTEGPVLVTPISGGVVVVDITEPAALLDGQIHGEVALRGVVHPVTSIDIRLVRVESMGSSRDATVVYDGALLDASQYDAARVLALQQELSGSNTPSRRQQELQAELQALLRNSPLAPGNGMQFSLDLSRIPVGPTWLPGLDQVGAADAALNRRSRAKLMKWLEEDAAAGRIAAGSDDLTVRTLALAEEANTADVKPGTGPTVPAEALPAQGNFPWPTVRYYLQVRVSTLGALPAGYTNRNVSAPESAEPQVTATAGPGPSIPEQLAADAREAVARSFLEDADLSSPIPGDAWQRADELIASTEQGTAWNTHEIFFVRQSSGGVIGHVDAQYMPVPEAIADGLLPSFTTGDAAEYAGASGELAPSASHADTAAGTPGSAVTGSPAMFSPAGMAGTAASPPGAAAGDTAASPPSEVAEPARPVPPPKSAAGSTAPPSLDVSQDSRVRTGSAAVAGSPLRTPRMGPPTPNMRATQSSFVSSPAFTPRTMSDAALSATGAE